MHTKVTISTQTFWNSNANAKAIKAQTKRGEKYSVRDRFEHPINIWYLATVFEGLDPVNCVSSSTPQNKDMMNAEKVEEAEKQWKGEAPPTIDLDYILVEEVGQFGKYQLTTLLLATLPVIFSAFASGEYIFTTARIPTR